MFLWEDIVLLGPIALIHLTQHARAAMCNALSVPSAGPFIRVVRADGILEKEDNIAPQTKNSLAYCLLLKWQIS